MSDAVEASVATRLATSARTLVDVVVTLALLAAWFVPAAVVYHAVGQTAGVLLGLGTLALPALAGNLRERGILSPGPQDGDLVEGTVTQVLRPGDHGDVAMHEELAERAEGETILVVRYRDVSAPVRWIGRTPGFHLLAPAHWTRLIVDGDSDISTGDSVRYAVEQATIEREVPALVPTGADVEGADR